MGDNTCLIDDFGPLPVHQPRAVAELGDLVRRAAAENLAVYPLGGRTMLGLGNRPHQPGLAVDLTEFQQIVDYPARDMTITVQAGIAIARLQAILAAENQRLPIDVPQADQATLGGILATNTSGPRRYGYGTLRDYVLGISAVNDEGHEIKAGGRVVKNVAGYDLCKLFIGSLGTLGIITQVTLKLRPLPEEQALVTLACPTEKIEGLLETLQGSQTRPVAVELVNHNAARAMPAAQSEAPWLVVVGYESNAEAAQWQVQQLIREVRGEYPLEARVGSAAGSLWQALGEFPTYTRGEGTLTFKANLLASATAGFCRQVDGLPERPQVQAHAGNGIVLGHVGPDLTPERALWLVKSLRDWAAQGQGRVVVLGCPPAWKDTLSVWGPPHADEWLMREVKNRLDPRGLFNPRRFGHQ